MKVKVTKITDKNLMDLACTYTAGYNVEVRNPYRMYTAEHSPARTQMFTVEMQGIPTFVSVHLVRHKFGVEHYVKSNREDRGGDSNADRNAPVNHLMLINAQALINMSRKRLCSMASAETRQVMDMIRTEVIRCDQDLACAMVPECVYRGGCPEFKSCGWHQGRK